LRTVNYVDQGLLNRIVDLVHTEVQVLYLRVFDSDPLFNFFSRLIDPFNRLNIIDLRNWLLWLLLGLQLLILLNNSITALHFFKMVLNLIGWKGEATNQLK